ncbi:DUF3290 family protein [Limosilactobacillus panis]|uniref:DUF3290 family protein n=1 Tax=Limosilactobacillus panis TaxID=47493 RepID=A0ABT7VL48_9LACO|nr:DUF3290 family protein [Limosilactobacillus panis]MDM8333443.1 DUF3290 family protein [Limosilactobacillus panis]
MTSIVNYSVIIILLLLIIFNASRYLHHQLRTRNRDLGIIFFLLLLIFTSLQVTNLEKDFNQHSQSLQMQPFIKAVARDNGLKSHQLAWSTQPR